MGDLSKSAVELQQTLAHPAFPLIAEKSQQHRRRRRLIFSFIWIFAATPLLFVICLSGCSVLITRPSSAVFLLLSQSSGSSFHVKKVWSGTRRLQRSCLSSHPKCLIFQEVQETGGSLSFLPNRQLHSVSALACTPSLGSFEVEKGNKARKLGPGLNPPL